MSKKILLIDDEKDILSVLKEFLELIGHEVYASNSGIEAMDILKDQLVDIVITDYEMPDINGIDLAKKIFDKYPSMKIFLLSGYYDFLTDDILKTSGIIKFIDKPFKIEYIENIINQ